MVTDRLDPPKPAFGPQDDPFEELIIVWTGRIPRHLATRWHWTFKHVTAVISYLSWLGCMIPLKTYKLTGTIDSGVNINGLNLLEPVAECICRCFICGLDKSIWKRINSGTGALPRFGTREPLARPCRCQNGRKNHGCLEDLLII